MLQGSFGTDKVLNGTSAAVEYFLVIPSDVVAIVLVSVLISDFMFSLK
jgi:hypothetical protein